MKQEVRSPTTLALLIEVIICSPETLGSCQKQYTNIHTRTHARILYHHSERKPRKASEMSFISSERLR